MLIQLILLFAGMPFIHGIGSRRIPDEQRLHYYLTTVNNYNKLIRPEGNSTAKGGLLVKLSLRLSQILDVSEKNQILTSSVWLRHVWIDNRLMWNPSDFGGIRYTQIPSEDLWRPDIVLYNNADGDFVMTLNTKARVDHTGLITWDPPAIFKSYCPIDVEFFPFDQQKCFFKFGSWTYDGHEVDLRHHQQDVTGIRKNDKVYIPNGVDLCDYSQNVEWDIINVTATKSDKFYPCCKDDPYPNIVYHITIRRKTLFYTINLILPIIAISTLTVLVFYLPSDSGEKITLSISILLALTVFFLLLSDINPPTSLVIPLIAKYLLFTMIIVTMSIFLTVYTLSVHFRKPATHQMSSWTKRVFTELLPRILCMKRPAIHSHKLIEMLDDEEVEAGTEMKQLTLPPPPEEEQEASENQPASPDYENLRKRTSVSESQVKPRQSTLMKESISGVKFIAKHLKKDAQEKSDMLDWNYVAMVMDRIFLYIFTTAAFCGTAGIFLNAPSLYDPRRSLTGSNFFNCSRG